MPRKTAPVLTLFLEEHPDHVTATVSGKSSPGSSIECPAPPIRAPYKTLTKAELVEVALKQAVTTGKTPVQVLEHYIRSRDKDILGELGKIRRETRRIEKMMTCVSKAKQAIEDLKNSGA